MAGLDSLGIKVEVLGGEPLQDSSGAYVAFKIRTSATEDNQGGFTPGTCECMHRYSDFDTLHQYLKCIFPAVVVPPMPEKKINFKITKMTVDKFDPAFIERRRVALEQFLRRVVSHPTLVTHPVIRHFLNSEGQWREQLVLEHEGSRVFWSPSHFDERVKSLNVALRLKRPEKEFTDLKAYALALQDNLSSILTSHAKLATRTQTLFAQYDEYGQLFNDWSALEFAIAPPGDRAAGDKERGLPAWLEATGRCIDRINGVAERKLEGEDHTVAEPLKEYVQYCDSLRDVALKQEQLQFEVEKATAAVAAKEQAIAVTRDPSQEKGLSGLFSRFSRTTDEERRAKEARLTEELTGLTEARTRANAENEEFKTSARDDVKRFQQQRRIDVVRILIAYARLQKEFCESNQKIWKEIRENCDKY